MHIFVRYDQAHVNQEGYTILFKESTWKPSCAPEREWDEKNELWGFTAGGTSS